MKLTKNITRISVKPMASACVLALVLGLASPQAAALGSTTYGFYNITHTNTINAANGETNLKVEVIELTNPNQVRFKFTNNSTSSLTDVYFDDGSLLGISSISDSGAGVSFSQGAAPPNLPGGNNANPPFVVTSGFSADSDAPTTKNGVTVGEWLAIDFNLINGKTYSNVLSALALPNNGGTGDLRIGVHVQDFAKPNPGSESFINESTVSPVPEADVWLMMMAGLGLVGFMARHKRYEAA